MANWRYLPTISKFVSCTQETMEYQPKSQDLQPYSSLKTTTKTRKWNVKSHHCHHSFTFFTVSFPSASMTLIPQISFATTTETNYNLLVFSPPKMARKAKMMQDVWQICTKDKWKTLRSWTEYLWLDNSSSPHSASAPFSSGAACKPAQSVLFCPPKSAFAWKLVKVRIFNLDMIWLRHSTF